MVIVSAPLYESHGERSERLRRNFEALDERVKITPADIARLRNIQYARPSWS